MIHPSASVDPAARVGRDVHIGAGVVIGADVEIGDRCSIGPYTVLEGPTTIGARTRISQFKSIGGPPQDKKYRGEASRLEIGCDNTIREFCTLNRGTDGGGGVTQIGDGNWIMSYVHVAHDCRVGDDTIMANGTTLAGHVTVGNHVIFGAFTVVHQFCAIGAHAFTAMGTVILKDVPPYVTVSGNSASPHGLNSEGLKRRGFSPEVVRELRRAYKLVYRQGLTVEQAIPKLLELAADCPEVAPLAEFLAASSRGIVR